MPVSKLALNLDYSAMIGTMHSEETYWASLSHHWIVRPVQLQMRSFKQGYLALFCEVKWQYDGAFKGAGSV
jgi:hypothetical protein